MTWIDAGMHLSLAVAAVASILSMMMLYVIGDVPHCRLYGGLGSRPNRLGTVYIAIVNRIRYIPIWLLQR